MWSSNYYTDLSGFLGLAKLYTRESKELAEKIVEL